MLRSSFLIATFRLVGLAGLLGLTGGCAVVYYAGMPLVYEKAEADGVTEFVDERYFDGPTERDEKTRLDLFFPPGEGWPVMVFAHGGGWTDGDKDLRVGGRDVYRNIGRFYSARGIGVAVINYRLLPGVHWRTQLRDVAHAVLYTRDRAGESGADTTRLFLAGHSAGAQLVSRVALDESILEGMGSSADIVCGVVAVSGAGYDFEDDETFALGADFEYFKSRYRSVDGADTWPHEASVVPFINEHAPPFLLVYGEKEHPGFIRQAALMADRLKEAGVPVDTLMVDGYIHTRMPLAMSRDDRQLGPATTDFVLGTDCGTR